MGHRLFGINRSPHDLRWPLVVRLGTFRTAETPDLKPSSAITNVFGTFGKAQVELNR